MELTTDQQDVINQITVFLEDPEEKLFMCSGSAGTGKTFVMAKALPIIHQKYENTVSVCAPTWKAARNLQKKLPLGSGVISLHSVVYTKPLDRLKIIDTKIKDLEEVISKGMMEVWADSRDILGELSKLEKEYEDTKDNAIHFSETHLLEDTLLLIDEGSMVGKKILDDAVSAGVDRIIVFGDHKQLGPVKEIPAFNLRGASDVELTKILRTKESSPIPYIASKVSDITRSALTVEKDLKPFTEDFTSAQTKPDICFKTEPDNTVCLAFTHAKRKHINNLYHDGVLKKGDVIRVFKTKNGVGRKNNDLTSGVDFISGDLYIFQGRLGSGSSKDPFFTAKLENVETGEKVETKVNWNDVVGMSLTRQQVKAFIYDKNRVEFTLPYCMTVHMSQGSEFENVYIDAKGYIGFSGWKKGLYTAITRAKSKFVINI